MSKGYVPISFRAALCARIGHSKICALHGQPIGKAPIVGDPGSVLIVS
jgi:hypothetical protein